MLHLLTGIDMIESNAFRILSTLVALEKVAIGYCALEPALIEGYRVVAEWVLKERHRGAIAVDILEKQSILHRKLGIPPPPLHQYLPNLAVAYINCGRNSEGIKVMREAIRAGVPMEIKLANMLLSTGETQDTQEAKELLMTSLLRNSTSLNRGALWILSRNFGPQVRDEVHAHPRVRKAVLEEGWKGKDYNDEYEKVSVNEGFKVKTITLDSKENIDWSFIREFRNRHEPLIIRGKGFSIPDAVGWKTHRWTGKYLRQKAGGVMMTMEKRNNTSGKKLYNFGVGNTYASVSLSDALDELHKEDEENKGPPRLYLALNGGGDTLDPYHPPLNTLKSDIRPPPFLTEKIDHVHMWMSGSQDTENVENASGEYQYPLSPPLIPVPSTSNLHCDGSENYNFLLKGKKEFLLFSPNDANKLYTVSRVKHVNKIGGLEWDDPKPEDFDPNFCLLDPADPAPHLYPRYQEAHPVKVTLNAGEMLYIPSNWFHQVTTFRPSLGVNFWFGSPRPTNEDSDNPH